MKLGVLHPGAMGTTVAASLRASGHQVYWLSEGRSRATRERAEGLIELSSTAALVDEVDHLISVCPPGAAASVAEAINKAGFEGLYVDANAVSPRTAKGIASRFAGNYVDGGIVGPPALSPGTTRLYLSGEQAETVAEWFQSGPLAAIAIGTGVATASSLKMCYAGYNKGVGALLLAVKALAEREGVADALASEWDLSQPELNARAEGSARSLAKKAWRFVDEMHEIARTFADADLPDGFHVGAAGIYQRMVGLERLDVPTFDDVLRALLAEADD